MVFTIFTMRRNGWSTRQDTIPMWWKERHGLHEKNRYWTLWTDGPYDP